MLIIFILYLYKDREKILIQTVKKEDTIYIENTFEGEIIEIIILPSICHYKVYYPCNGTYEILSWKNIQPYIISKKKCLSYECEINNDDKPYYIDFIEHIETILGSFEL